MHVLRSFVAHRDKFTTKSVYEVKDMNFTKLKEAFVYHIQNNQKLLRFMHMCYYVGDMQ